MKKSIAQLTALSRNAVPNAKSGKKKAGSEKNPERETDWTFGAKTACGHICESVTRKTGRA
jgi:hypothetical protein